MFDPWRSAAVYADAVATRLKPAAAWQRLRAERLQSLLCTLSQRSAWWQQRVSAALRLPVEHVAERLAALPLSRKGDLMSQFGCWVTDPSLELAALRGFARRDRDHLGAYDGRIVVWESSGSRGEPALFAQDADALAVYDALEAARGPAVLLDRTRGADELRLAFVGAVDGPFASIVSLQRLRALNPWLARRSRAFSFLQPLPALMEQLERWRPNVLSTYPSLAWLLAREQLAGRLSLSLQALWTGGEDLTHAGRAAIEHAFGCPVRNSYGASECLTIAFECAHRSLHLNADWVVLEPVDEQGQPVPPGETGARALLTNLANTLQPIVRYDLGDRVRIGALPCRCGSPLPTIEVAGRCDDMLTLQRARGSAVHLAPLALTTVLEDEGGVFDFRLAQRGPRRLCLDLYGTDGQHCEGAAAALKRFLHLQGASGVVLQVRALARPAQRGRSGKQPRVVNETGAAAISDAPSPPAPAAAPPRHATTPTHAHPKAPTSRRAARDARAGPRRSVAHAA